MSVHQVGANDVPGTRRNYGRGIEGVIERMEYRGGALTFHVYVAIVNPQRHEIDYYETDSLELARGVYEEGIRRLTTTGELELAKIATELKIRRPSLATGTRRVFRDHAAGGGLILGDTPPDELPKLG